MSWTMDSGRLVEILEHGIRTVLSRRAWYFDCQLLGLNLYLNHHHPKDRLILECLKLMEVNLIQTEKKMDSGLG